jgi:hypothetical protein
MIVRQFGVQFDRVREPSLGLRRIVVDGLRP